MQQYPPQRLLTLPEIRVEVKTLHEDAARWTHIRLPTAQRRLDEAKAVIADGLKLAPKSAYLIVLQGYIELTQSNISSRVGNPQAATAALEAAAEYFATALRLNPSSASAINGMAWIYLLTKLYDSAINYSKIAIRQDPNYSSPYWTLTHALEGKMRQFGPDLSSLTELMVNYKQLENLLSNDRGCSASDYNYVLKRRKEIKDALGKEMKDALGELDLDIWGLLPYYG